QAGFSEQILGELAAQGIAQQKAGVRRVSNAKCRNGLVVQTATLQILARMRALRTPQICAKKLASAVVDIEQLAANLRIAGLSGTGVRQPRQRHATLLRNQADGLGEGDVFNFLNEGKYIAGRAATKAVKELTRGMHGKRCRLLAMKRTQPGIVLRPGLLKLDVIADDANDVGLLLQSLGEFKGRRHEEIRRRTGPEGF